MSFLQVARAPGRVELLGNHTDYNEGVVLSAAINYAITARGEIMPGREVSIGSALEAEPVRASLDALTPAQDDTAWANYPLGVAAILQAEGYALGGFRMQVESDLPAGAGLSSSAALEVATARLLTKLYSLDIDPLRLAKLCRRAENDFVGMKCGLLDQVSSVFGKRGHAVYLDCRTEVVDNIPLPADSELLVFHCGVPHQLTGGEYNERREQCFAAAEMLGTEALRDVSSEALERGRALLPPIIYRRAAHIVGENERVFAGIEALRRGDGRAFGALMFTSHESSRTNFENSTPALDALVDIARSEPGVYGSRLSGGGFGGATISLVERSRAEAIAASMEAKYTARTGNHGKAYLCESADGAD